MHCRIEASLIALIFRWVLYPTLTNAALETLQISCNVTKRVRTTSSQ